VKIGLLIRESEKLTGIFGYWPSFHDAEILELNFHRGNVRPEKSIYEFPVLTLRIHLWELTKEVDQRGYLVLRNHTLTTLKFSEVSEFKMEGFNHQNAMMGLAIEREDRTRGPSPYYFRVSIDPAFGMGCSFECLGVEVIDAIACTDNGETIPTAPIKPQQPSD
jgi:Immunity protein 50